MENICIFNNLNTDLEKYTNVTDDGGVKKLIIKQGVGNIVSPGASVEVHYSAYHNEDLKIPFDSTRLRRKTYSVYIPQNRDAIRHVAMSGIEIGITTMKLDEESIFILQPKYAMGAQGCYPRVPPNATCFVTIVVTSVGYTRALEYEDLPRSEKRYADYEIFESAMLRRKHQAKLAFDAKNYQNAVEIYKKAVIQTEMYSAKDEVDDIRRNKISIDIENNMTLCYLWLNNPTNALKLAEEVLNKDQNNVKAHFYKAKASRLIGNLHEAEKELKLAKKLEPNNKSIHKECAELEKELDILEENSKKMWMLSNIKEEKTISNSEKNKMHHLVSEAVSDLIEKTIERFIVEDYMETFTFTSEYYNYDELNLCEQLSMDKGLIVKRTIDEDDPTIIYIFISK